MSDDLWILDRRDTYVRGGPYPGRGEASQACFYEQLPPLTLEPSSAACPSCRSALEPQIWRSPCRVRALVWEGAATRSPSGSECGDLLQGGAFELVVSDEVRAAFLADGLVGLVSFQAIDARPSLPRAYVAGRPRVTVTRLDEGRSGCRWRRAPTCAVCRLGVREHVERVVLDRSSLDGSDIFMASGFYGAIVVSDRFVAWVARHGFTNFRFVPCAAYTELP